MSDNPIFKQLAEECGFDVTAFDPDIEMTQEDIDYFGERIVQECIRVCEDENQYEIADLLRRYFHLDA